MTTETLDAPKAKGGFMKKIAGLLMKAVLAVLLVGAGFGGGYYYFANPMSPADNVLQLLSQPTAVEGATDANGEPQRQVREVPATTLYETTYYQFEEPLTTNLSGSRRYLQVGIGISTQYGQEVIDNVTTHKLALQSDILAVVSHYSETDVEGLDGRNVMAAEIRDAMNTRLEALVGFGGIEDVFFSTFILQ